MNILEQEIRSVNNFAKLLKTTQAKVDLHTILDINAYGCYGPTSMETLFGQRGFSTSDVHSIDKSVRTTTVQLLGRMDRDKLDDILQQLLWEKSILNSAGSPMEILRLKGVVAVDDNERRMVLQAVHELYDVQFTTPWGEDKTTAIMVFIGRNLDNTILKQLLESCLLTR